MTNPQDQAALQPVTLQDSDNSRSKTIILTGGGSGGHVTPILAVAHEIKKLHPKTRIIYIGERNGKFASLTEKNPNIDDVYSIHAGKFRRYHGQSWLIRLMDIPTNVKNLRDLFLVIFGVIQSLRLLSKLSPDVIFLKGGYVGMPVGLAGAIKRKLMITHDSDAVPGLANRVVSRWVRYHATALPAQHYKYPKQSVKHVGVLVSEDYKPVNSKQQDQYKSQLHIPANSRVLLVTGGSQGARRINLAMVKVIPGLIERFRDLVIIHQVGKGNSRTYGGFHHPRLRIVEFMDPMYVYTGASDLVVTRAGANTLAELGVQGRASVVIPNPNLTGGHQLKNAQYLETKDAAVVIKEKQLSGDFSSLTSVLDELLSDSSRRSQLGKNLQSITIADASSRLALLLTESIN